MHKGAPVFGYPSTMLTMQEMKGKGTSPHTLPDIIAAQWGIRWVHRGVGLVIRNPPHPIRCLTRTGTMQVVCG